MLLGIDIGGTHTDAVLLDRGRLIESCKIPTGNLTDSVREALEIVLNGHDPKNVQRFNLSTTLSTNAIVKNVLDDVGVIYATGPGVQPELLKIGKHFHVVNGWIDHQGNEVEPLDEDAVYDAAADLKHEGVQVAAVVSKFCTRRPEHEKRMARIIKRQFDFVTLGHRLSGRLNVKRRIATAYYNAAVWRSFQQFMDAVEQSTLEFGLNCPVHILKADGGTLPAAAAREQPVQTILSGPAASVMGVLAVHQPQTDAVMLDIGGTTTDIAVFAGGMPLLERDGVTLAGHPTLVRAIRTRSIPVGGDAVVEFSDRELKLQAKPEYTTAAPTLTDALNVLGEADFGDVNHSREKMQRFAAEHEQHPKKLAEQAVQTALTMLQNEIDSILQDIQERPVYTVHDMLYPENINPKSIFVIGGPAAALQNRLQQTMQRPVHVAGHSGVVNAIGAALSRITAQIDLFADTTHHIMRIPQLERQEYVDRDYSLAAAKRDAATALEQTLNAVDAHHVDTPIDILEAQSFNRVQNFIQTGKNIRVTCQTRPGLISNFSKGGE